MSRFPRATAFEHLRPTALPACTEVSGPTRKGAQPLTTRLSRRLQLATGFHRKLFLRTHVRSFEVAVPNEGWPVPAKTGRTKSSKTGLGPNATVYSTTTRHRPDLAIKIPGRSPRPAPAPVPPALLPRGDLGRASHPNIVPLRREMMPALPSRARVEVPFDAPRPSGRLDSPRPSGDRAAASPRFRARPGIVHRDIRPANIILATDKRSASPTSHRPGGCSHSSPSTARPRHARVHVPEQIAARALCERSSLSRSARTKCCPPGPSWERPSLNSLEALAPSAEPKELRAPGTRADFMSSSNAPAWDPQAPFADAASFARALKSARRAVPGDEPAPSPIAVPEPFRPCGGHPAPVAPPLPSYRRTPPTVFTMDQKMSVRVSAADGGVELRGRRRPPT
jgi:hypothetical protein